MQKKKIAQVVIVWNPPVSFTSKYEVTCTSQKPVWLSCRQVSFEERVALHLE